MVVVGGWTEDTAYADALEETNSLPGLFRVVVKNTVLARLANTEIASGLSAPEKSLEADIRSSTTALDRVIEFIKLDTSVGKWPTDGMLMSGANIASTIANQWLNILKRYE